MCVIFIVESERPTPEMVTNAFEKNKHGGGAAWRDGGLVYWKKDLKLPEMQELAAVLPMPYVLHFRIASSGGVRPELTHPFEVSRNPSTELQGVTDGRVLFHNGDWKDWQDVCLNTAIKLGGDEPIPGGHWSDSRAMGWLGSVYGPGFYNFLHEKLVIMGPGEDDFAVHGYGWKEINKVWCSNDGFMPTVIHGFTQVGGRNTQSFTCLAPNCHYNSIVGSTYCFQHQYLDQDDGVCEAETCLDSPMKGSSFCWKHRFDDPDYVGNTHGGKQTQGGRDPLEQRLMSRASTHPDLVLRVAIEENRKGLLGTNALKRVRAAVKPYLKDGDGQPASTQRLIEGAVVDDEPKGPSGTSH